MRESTVERKICDYAKSIGVVAEKLAGPNDRGREDRMFTKDGVAAFLEIKAPGRRPTALQLKRMKSRRANGFNSEWVDCEEGGVQFLDMVFPS